MTREAVSLDLSKHEGAVRSTRAAQRALADDAAKVMKQRLAVPEVSTLTGEHQRHQVRVPTRKKEDGTVISAGRRQDGRNYDGYGLTTNSHVVASAEGGKKESTMTLQSNGQLLVQSDDDSAYVVSAGPAVLASAAVTNVVASGGVVIAAGGAIAVKNDPVAGKAPKAPAALAKHGALMGEATKGWGTWSGAVDAAVAARDQLSELADPEFKTEWTATQASVTSRDLASDTHGTRNPLGKSAAAKKGGVAVYGEAGFVIGTPKFGAVHAEEALSLSSKNPSIAATEHLDLSAAEDASLTAGNNVALIGAQRVRVIANEGDLTLAARTGDAVEVMGKAIHLGQLEPDEPQEETELVSVRAKKRISLATDDDGEREEGDDGIWLKTPEVIDGLADSTIQLAAGESITLKIDDDTEYSIMVESGGAITITSDATTFTISDDDGLVFGDDDDDYLKASSDSIYAGVDSDHCIEISSDEVSIKGDSIELG